MVCSRRCIVVTIDGASYDVDVLASSAVNRAGKSGLMATRLCVILHSIVTLAMLLRVSREFHSRWSRIDVTLLVLWNLPVVYLAALSLTFSSHQSRLLYLFSDITRYKLFSTSTDYFKFSFFPHTVVLWNALPPDIVSASSLDQFKSQIQTHYI
jgi:hypothetical protein